MANTHRAKGRGSIGGTGMGSSAPSSAPSAGTSAVSSAVSSSFFVVVGGGGSRGSASGRHVSNVIVIVECASTYRPGRDVQSSSAPAPHGNALAGSRLASNVNFVCVHGRSQHRRKSNIALA